MKHFYNGMTVRDLKLILKDWDEGDEDQLSEVWISTGKGLSSQVKVVFSLNTSDLLLES